MFASMHEWVYPLNEHKMRQKDCKVCFVLSHLRNSSQFIWTIWKIFPVYSPLVPDIQLPYLRKWNSKLACDIPSWMSSLEKTQILTIFGKTQELSLDPGLKACPFQLNTTGLLLTMLTGPGLIMLWIFKFKFKSRINLISSS